MEMSRASELVIKAWKLADIVGSEHIQILRMPDPEASPSKVCSTTFAYTSSITCKEYHTGVYIDVLMILMT